MKVFWLRRLLGLAQIADGIGTLIGFRFGLSLRTAKKLAKTRYEIYGEPK